MYRAVSQLIAANEDRPEFLISLFRELQMLSRNDPLRARLMQAFEELERRQAIDDEVTQSVHPTQTSIPSCNVAAATLQSYGAYDPESVVRAIVDEIADFLNESRHYSDGDDTIRERIATIAMRELTQRTQQATHRGSQRAAPVVVRLTRDELLRNMPPLDRRRPVPFLSALMRYLSEAVESSVAVETPRDSSLRAAAAADNRNVLDATPPATAVNRRKRRQVQKISPTSQITECGARVPLVAPLAAQQPAAEQPKQPQQQLNAAGSVEMGGSSSSSVDAAAANRSSRNKDDDNEDLAEADQVCSVVSAADGEDDNEEGAAAVAAGVVDATADDAGVVGTGDSRMDGELYPFGNEER